LLFQAVIFILAPKPLLLIALTPKTFAIRIISYSLLFLLKPL
jgi:hypothetical protein